MAAHATAIPADAGAVLAVDLDAIADNFRLIRDACPGAEVGAAVKADAYGLGLAPVSRALAAAGCSTFFVATAEEGKALRQSADDAEIIVLNGPEPGNLETLRAARLTPALNSLGQVDVWAAADAAAGAALHVDTGMNRLGLGPQEVDRIADAPERLAGIRIPILMSHLACADTPGHPMNAGQRDRFADLRERLAPVLGPVRASLANSPGLFLGREFHFDLVRPGAALYGLRPHAGGTNPLRQAVEMHTKILQVRDIDTPMSVGYGAAHRVARRARIATLAAGYADGYPRAAGATEGSPMHAYIAGQAAPLVGRISMDLITLDVSGVTPELVRPGQTVELLGPNVSPDDLADGARTIAYEVLSRLGARLHRVYRGGRG